MFGFNVLTWNTGYQEHTYFKSISRAIMGGSPGHAAAELVIPLTPENRALIEAVNIEGKLLVREDVTLVGRAIEKKPYFIAEKTPCFKIYFSFWNDASTLKTPQGHMMVGLHKDKLVKSKENPIQYTEKGKVLLEQNPEQTARLKTWLGLSPSVSIEHIQHMEGFSDEQLSLSKDKLKLLETNQNEKKLQLEDIKKICNVLNSLKTTDSQQAYLASEGVQAILKKYNVISFEALKLQLAAKSAAISNLHYELTALGVSFGTPPDNIVSFPITEQLESGLDYKQMIREMARIANSRVPYHGLQMNCATTTLAIIRAGISDQLKLKLEADGYSIPQSNTFFETPQSVFNFSLAISSALININSGVKEKHSNLFSEFSLMVHDFFIKLLSSIFKPSYQQQLNNLKIEYNTYLTNAKAELMQLNIELKSGEKPPEIYNELHTKLNHIIREYTQKIAEIDLKLFKINNSFVFWCAGAHTSETEEHNASTSLSLQR